MVGNIPAQSSTSSLNAPIIHSYAFNEFANQRSALNSIENQVTDGRAGKPIQQPIVNIWGVSGVGKSWLLCHTEHKYAFQPPETDGKKKRLGTVAALADFRDFEATLGGLMSLFTTLTDKLVEHTQNTGVVIQNQDEAIDTLRAAIETFAAGRKQQDAAANAFVMYLEMLTEHFVPLLLFDTFEKLEEGDFDAFLWFEKDVLGPTVRANRAMVVLASRYELRRFRQFEVRRRIRKLELGAFDRSETAEQYEAIPIQAFEQAAQALYRFSAGLPFANWYLQEKLSKLLKEDQIIDTAFVNSHLAEIMTLLVEVERWLLSAARTPGLADRLRLVATLRHFHIRSMQLLLIDLEGDDSLRDNPDSYFQEVITEMLATHLVRWSPVYGGYLVDPAVRGIINQRLLLQEPDTFQVRHNCALKLYQGWIKEIPYNNSRFVIEAVFHIVTLAQATKVPDEAVRKEILDLLQISLGYRQFDKEEVDDLISQWYEDDELQSINPALFKNEEFRQAVYALAGRSEEAAHD